MRISFLGFFIVLISFGLSAKDKTETKSSAKAVTVQATIDHNRIVIPVEVALPDGSMQTIRAWVDNGNPELNMSRRLAGILGLKLICTDKECTAPTPREVDINGMSISLSDAQTVKIPLQPVEGAAVLAPGMNAEINIPSTILRHYDVLVDFPEHKFSIGLPGAIRFQGSSAKVQINAENGLIQIPSVIEKKKYNLGLDLGACISFLSDDLFAKLETAHSDWPHMTGAVGSANMWGSDEETKWQIMRVDRVQFGPLYLTNVPFVSFPPEFMSFFEKRAGIVTAGLIGAEVLQNYRVGLDYAHSTVYFDIGRLFNFPDFDVIGLVLRPEVDGGYTILGVANIDGKPVVGGVLPGDHLEAVNNIPVHGVTMGQVWAMLGGTPGQERTLIIERGGKQITVVAKVQHFLAEASDDTEHKGMR